MTKKVRISHEQCDATTPTVEVVRDGPVNSSKDSISLMLFTSMSGNVNYTVGVMNISKLKEKQVSRLSPRSPGCHWDLSDKNDSYGAC